MSYLMRDTSGQSPQTTPKHFKADLKEQGVSVWTLAYLLGIIGRIQQTPDWCDISIRFFFNENAN